MDAALFLPLALMGMVIAHYTYKFSREKLAMQVEADSSSRAEIEALKRRVATLEQLLTDGDRKLAGEIERLRRSEHQPGA